MSNSIVLAPVLIPLLTAIMLLFCYRNQRLQVVLSAMSAICGLGVAFYLFSLVLGSGIQVLWVGNWAPPFGITIVADLFSSIMVILCNIVGLACLFFSFATIDKERVRNFYYTLIQMLLVGINGSFLTGDIFNLFVFFEIMLVSSYVLIVLGSTAGQLRESFKYVIISVFSSGLFLMGVGLLYGMVGTLNMADVAHKMAQIDNQGLVSLVGMIFLVVFGIKGALFPLFFWLPKAYMQPPTVVSALFGGLLTKVGVYALIRVFTLIFIGDVAFTHTVILIIAACTMFFGVLGALFHYNFKSILAYNLISHVGFIIMGLGLFSPLAIAGAIFYTAHHMVVKTVLFLLSGVTERLTGTNDLKKMGGLLRGFPLLGWTFFIAALSLSGIPPFSGFFGKLVLLQGAVEQERFYIIAIALFVGFLTLFSMSRIFTGVFWGEEKPVLEQEDNKYSKLMPICVLMVGLSVMMGFGAQFVLNYAILAADQLMNPQLYIDAVLNFGE